MMVVFTTLLMSYSVYITHISKRKIIQIEDYMTCWANLLLRIWDIVKDYKFEASASITNDRPILVSQKEIEKRRRTTASNLASFAVDNIPINSDTQHIFKDFEEGKISINKQEKALLHAHYTKVAFKNS